MTDCPTPPQTSRADSHPTVTRITPATELSMYQTFAPDVKPTVEDIVCISRGCGLDYTDSPRTITACEHRGAR
jgi:hypothetical protein